MSGSDLHSQKATGVELERLLFFSDAVFAIAITLLVLEIKVPEREAVHSAAELMSALGALFPHYFAFVLSFAVIGYYWYMHHVIFRYVRQWNDLLVALNMVLLLCIAFLPFPVAVFGSFRHFEPALVLYATSLGVTGLVQLGLWLYATTKRRLVDPALPRVQIRLVTLRAVVLPAVFTIQVPLAFASPTLRLIFLLALIPAVRIARARITRAG